MDPFASVQNMQLNPAEQRELEATMQRRMVSDLMTFINGITQRCFDLCVSDTTTRTLSGKEKTCLERCFDRQRNSAERLTMRFQEAAQKAAAKAEAVQAAQPEQQPNYLSGDYYSNLS